VRIAKKWVASNPPPPPRRRSGGVATPTNQSEKHMISFI